jgi:hypothetical protein
MAQPSRRRAILALAAACLALAGIGAYGRYAVLDEGHFADRAASALASDEVDEEIGARVGAEIVTDHPRLAPAQAALEDAVADRVARDPAFRAEFRAATVRLHRAVFADANADASLVLRGSGAAVRRGMADRMHVPLSDVPSFEDLKLLSIGGNRREHALRELAPSARDLALRLTIGFGIAGLGLLAVGFARAPDRRSGTWSAALAVAAAGGLVAAGLTAALDVVLTHFDTGFGDAVVRQIWSAYLGDLRTWALSAAAAGLVVAAAAGGPRLSLERLGGPRTRLGRLARAAALLVLAAVAVLMPELLLHVGLIALAGAFVYVAAGDILRALSGGRDDRRLEPELPEHHERVPVDRALDDEPVLVAGGDDRSVGLGPAPGRR